jgi:hypothetical protein
MKSTGENRQLGEKPVPMPFCPPQISHGLDLGSNPGLRGERPAPNRLSHGTADECNLHFDTRFYLCLYISHNLPTLNMFFSNITLQFSVKHFFETATGVTGNRTHANVSNILRQRSVLYLTSTVYF